MPKSLTGAPMQGEWKEVIREPWGEISPCHCAHANRLVKEFDGRNAAWTDYLGFPLEEERG